MILRAPRSSDLGSIYKMGANPHVMQYITYGKPQTIQEAREDLWRRKRTARRRLGYWAAEERSSGAFIGWMALKRFDSSGREVEIGYRFLEEQWGKGYATEGSVHVLEYAFENLGVEKAIALSMKENRASIRVMEKLGMARRGNMLAYGVDCVRYEITRRQFAQRHLLRTIK